MLTTIQRMMHLLRRKSIHSDTNAELRTLQTFLDSDEADPTHTFEKTLWKLQNTARNTTNLRIAEPHLHNITRSNLFEALLNIQKDAMHSVMRERAKSCYF